MLELLVWQLLCRPSNVLYRAASHFTDQVVSLLKLILLILRMRLALMLSLFSRT